MQEMLDAIDRRILQQLQLDAKQTNAELAARIGLSESPCSRRVRLLEERGLIDRYVALLDPRRLGLEVHIFTHVTMEKQIDTNLARFEAAIAGRPEIMECYLMTGDADYMLRVLVASIAAYERFLLDFLTKIPGVSNIRSSFALKQVKYGTALPL